MSCENTEENVPVGDGAAASPLLDAYGVLVAAGEAAPAADVLAGQVRRGEAAATDGGRAGNDTAVRTCTDVSILRAVQGG